MRTELLLLAYPRRWRESHGEELRAVIEDAAGPPVRVAIDLVRGGWLTRWRTRPPWHVVAGYRLAGRRPAARYDGWLRDDVESPLHPLWEASWTLALTLPLTLVGARIWPGWAIGLWVGAAATFIRDLVVSARGRAALRARLFGSGPDIGPWLPYRPGVGLEAEAPPPADPAGGHVAPARRGPR